MSSARAPKPFEPFVWVIFAFFGVFGVIGLLLLAGIWTSAGPFQEVPVFFRLFASCIALCFIVIGFGVPLSARWRRSATASPPNPPAPPAPGQPVRAEAGAGYQCPNCGASLGTDQEVSPSGDAKCRYCHRWWNIHRPLR